MCRKLLSLFVGLLSIQLCVSCTSYKSYPPLKEVDYVNPQQFEGEWYVIANIPYFAEKNKVGGKVIYRKRDEIWYDDIYKAHKSNFSNDITTLKGKTKSLNQANTLWQSTFYRFFKFNYHIISMDENYQIMLLAHPSRKYGWVMARKPMISEQNYQMALSVFMDNQYDITKFSKVPQKPSDIGQKGYQ